MASKRMFPVLLYYTARKAHPNCPRSVPWAILAPHERQALRNHEQTLVRLAERGGLDPTEMLAVLEDRRWTPMDCGDAVGLLLKKLAAHAAAVPASPQSDPKGVARG